MKKVLVFMISLCVFGQLHAQEVGSVERGAAALTLLQGLPEILILDVPEVERDLIKRQHNLSLLKGNITLQKSKIKVTKKVDKGGNPVLDKNGKQKEEKSIPVTDIIITTYLALAEFKDVVDIFIYIVEDIFQKKLILPIATILGQKETDSNYIGKYLNKVKDVLKNASNQLKEFLAIQNMIVVIMDTSFEKLNAQRKQLTEPMG